MEQNPHPTHPPAAHFILYIFKLFKGKEQNIIY